MRVSPPTQLIFRRPAHGSIVKCFRFTLFHRDISIPVLICDLGLQVEVDKPSLPTKTFFFLLTCWLGLIRPDSQVEVHTSHKVGRLLKDISPP